MIKVFVLFLFFFLTLQESETISVDDVSDIFKMYGVDYKEVREGSSISVYSNISNFHTLPHSGCNVQIQFLCSRW